MQIFDLHASKALAGGGGDLRDRHESTRTCFSTLLSISNAIVYGCSSFGATNASKHSIDQSEDRILQINQSKNALKYS